MGRTNYREDEVMNFKVNVSASDGYKIRMLEDVDSKDLSFIVDEINFYDDNKGDDVIIEIDGSKLQFDITQSKEEDDAYEIGFQGDFSAEISDDELTLLEENEFIVDYNLIIERDGEDFEQDECYELIHNTSVAIEKK
jgi:hypothetical protein